MSELDMVAQALDNLALNNPVWNSNLITYVRMTPVGQATWWLRAQVQAARSVPAMQALVNEFIAVRLTS